MVKIPDPFQHYRSYRDKIHYKQWERELQCKDNVMENLTQIISSIESLKDWYQNTDMGVYINLVTEELASLSKHHIHYDNYYHAYIDSKEDMLERLEHELRYDEYLQQRADSDVLRDIDDQRIYLTRKSIQDVRSIRSGWLIRRVDEDNYHHSNVYYQGMDGDSLVHFCCLVLDAIHVDTITKEKIYEI